MLRVQACLDQAKACAEAAAVRPTHNQYVDFIRLELSWIKLALSYTQAAQIDDFISETRDAPLTR